MFIPILLGSAGGVLALAVSGLIVWKVFDSQHPVMMEGDLLEDEEDLVGTSDREAVVGPDEDAFA